MDNAKQSETPDPGKHRFLRYLRNRFLTGVVIAVPVAITIWLITWFVRIVDGRVLSLVPPGWNPNLRIKELIGLSIPGTGIIIAFIFLFLLGVFASNFIGTSILSASERLLARVPFVSNIYNALKQIVNTVAAQSDKAFKEVCLVEYPRKGIWAIGFVTSQLKGAPAEVLDDRHVCVFVPTTPNPTSGFLLFVPREDIKILAMTPEEGAKMIISGGMVSSNEDLETKTENGPSQKALAKLKSADPKKLPKPGL